MNTKLKKAWNTVSTIIVVLVVIFAVVLIGVRLVGIQPYTVLSSSMEPKYPTGSLIYVKKVDYKTLKVGDNITFMLNEDTVATHQIIEIVPDAKDENILKFRTQGIANETPDGGAVHCNNVIGKPVFMIPYLGYVANYIQNPPGLYVTIAAVAILLILFFFPDILRVASDDTKKKKNEDADGGNVSCG